MFVNQIYGHRERSILKETERTFKPLSQDYDLYTLVLFKSVSLKIFYIDCYIEIEFARGGNGFFRKMISFLIF